MPKQNRIWNAILLFPLSCSLLASCASAPQSAGEPLNQQERIVTQVMSSQTPEATEQVPTQTPSTTTTLSPTAPASSPTPAAATPFTTATVMPSETPQHHPASQQAQEPAVAPAVEPTVGAPAQLAPAAAAAVQKARRDLVQRLGDTNAPIELLSVAPRFKPNGASDTPGRLIGWNIRFAVGDYVYMYQVDSDGTLRRRS